MTDLLPYILPEILLLLSAGVLFVLGTSTKPTFKRLAAAIAVLSLITAALAAGLSGLDGVVVKDSLSVSGFSMYIKAIACGMGALFVLLAWPTSASGDGNRSINFSTETGEYFALLLLAITGVCITASANSLPTLFLGIELASIPTYIMVTMSRPQLVAQEAGIKYFFLGAASAAIMLLGMSYLFGFTGQMGLTDISVAINSHLVGGQVMPAMLLLALVLMVLSFLFKLAAVPMHFYAGDVYQGAATPVTAAISFIPKVAGTVALMKLLFVAGGGLWSFDPQFSKFLWIIAILTMTVGNIVGLLQYNVKRVLAYSSIAHSGYILAGLATVTIVSSPQLRTDALGAVALYLLVYGVMNTAAFGVMMMLPSRSNAPATTAETYDDLAGQGRKHPLLGLAMAIACFSLIGMPMTAGFFGKLFLIKPAIQSGQSDLIWLAIFVMINAAISAAYYLKIVATMWSKTAPDEHELPAERPWPIMAAVTVSVAVVLAIGVIFPLAGAIYRQTTQIVSLLIG
jgi:NADH-quinone oxidoreductase subunit N